MAPRVSILIPFHNAAETIGRTVASVAAQPGLEKMEVVFVDDGSTDRTAALLEQELRALGDRFPARTIVSHQFRRGSADAIASALGAAKGDFIIKLDADDELTPDAIGRLLDAIDREGADIAWGGLEIVKGPRHSEDCPPAHAPGLNDAPIDTLHFSMCNKLIRRSLLDADGIMPFENVNCWEDVGVVARLMARDPKIAVVRRAPVYRYHLTPGMTSLSRSHRDIILRDHLLCALMLEKWFIDRGLDFSFEPFLTRLKFIAKVKFLRGPEKDVTAWRETFPEVNTRIMGIRKVGLIYRLLFTLMARLPLGAAKFLASLPVGRRF